MYARTTTFQGDPRAVEDGIGYVRDAVIPLVNQLDGSTGLSMLADRFSGRCIVTTGWTTQRALHDSADAIRGYRVRAAEILGCDPAVAGCDPAVQEWEIALLHRLRPTPEGACTRVIWRAPDLAKLDDNIDMFRMALLPKMEELPGFCSTSLLVDRSTGESATAVTYESRSAMTRANAKAIALRKVATRAIGTPITEVGEFDLVLAHLRVPETV